MKRTAIYAGTFDPITLGHLDVAERASRAGIRALLEGSEPFAAEAHKLEDATDDFQHKDLFNRDFEGRTK